MLEEKTVKIEVNETRSVVGNSTFRRVFLLSVQRCFERALNISNGP